MYGRDADDTLEWIQEKDLIVSSDDYGHDLESSQALISRHEGLEVSKWSFASVSPGECVSRHLK